MCNNYDSVITGDFLSEPQRFGYWVNIINNSPNPIQIDSSERADFNAKVSILNMGETNYFLSEGKSPLAAHRTRQDIARANTHPFHLMVKLMGGGSVRQRKSDAILSAGDFVLIDTKQELESTMDNSQAILLSIPDALVRAWIPNPEDYVGRVLRGHKGWPAVLASYLSNLDTTIVRGAKRHQHILMVEHILSIYLFALEEANFIRKPDDIFSKKQKIDLYIPMYNWLRENYMDSEISAALIARHFGISTREVHRQFSLSPEKSTFLEVLRAMRLTAAVRMLKDPHFSLLTISEIGYRSGFIDSAYFGRVFRKIMNCSPGVFAKAHQKRLEAGEAADDIIEPREPPPPPNDRA